ncbi:MAG TPA: hypothetical protein VHB79_37125 [Polyangiaceae bacterium]|nr:hypothetical protein [Polyangiaceae bacterium]
MNRLPSAGWDAARAVQLVYDVSDSMKLLGAILCTAILSGCVAAPASNDELAESGALVRTSEAGLVRGRLTVLGSVEQGSNDFELELSPESPNESAKLEAMVAVMPNHGHRAEPTQIERTEAGYRILGLPLSMPGVWQVRAEIIADERADEITFEVDVP